ncbi:MAG: hypothetical protein Q8R40_02080 [bacterium]|nr:hypothetical protein [bacterium]
MDMREPIPGENLIEAAKPTRGERGNKHQWEQELGGVASLNRITRGERHLVIVAAEHFSEQAATYFRDDISAEITNPEDWYFLVEGKDSGVHECEVAGRIAKEKKIPIEDPVFHPFQAEVIELYLASDRAGNIPREILIGQLSGTLANARGTSDLEEVATILGVASSQELYLNMVLAAAEKNKDPEGYSARSKQMFDGLTEISNTISAQVLDYYLRHNPARKHEALYLGKAHEGIAGKDLSQIPENLKFNDDQISDLLDKRDKARVAQILRAFGITMGGAEEIPSALEPVTRKAEQKTTKKPSRKTRIDEVLNELSDIPENLRILIKKWSDNLFGLHYVRSRGYQEYLDSDNSLYQIWGASALLADRVDVAKSENRELTPEEITGIEEAFLKAAYSRRKDADVYMSQGDEIEELSKGIGALAKIIRRL